MMSGLPQGQFEVRVVDVLRLAGGHLGPFCEDDVFPVENVPQVAVDIDLFVHATAYPVR